MLAESTDQPHLIDALHRVCVALGGLTRTWRFDRMATVCHPGTGQVTASFAAVAKHYGVSVAICPPRRGNRKGVVEKANHTAAQRWWRTLADDVSVEQAQASLDRWCRLRGDTRMRPTTDGKATVATVAAAEPLTALPAPFPAVLAVQRVASAQALVAFRGNHYSVPPELARAQITVTHRLGAAGIELATSGGIVIARHHLAPAGAGATVRDTGHVLALERAAMAAFTNARAAPPQAAHPTRPGRPGRRRGPARRPLRTGTVHTRHSDRRGRRRGRGRPHPLRRRSPGKEHPPMSTPTSTSTSTARARARARAIEPNTPRRPASTSSCAATSLRSSCTPPPSTFPPCSTGPPPRSCR